jgi:hypothetical protein
MAFIIVGDLEQEWERRPLRQAITIGRSFDCDLPVRDTLLSRKHCRLEPHGKQWVLIDLKSRNGTRVGENPISRKILEDGDVVRIGQTRLCFRAGAFMPAAAPSPIPSRARPLDPHEAMAATLAGAELTANTAELHVPGFPTPKPQPSEPRSYQSDGVAALVSKMASGVWDSRLANQALARRPAHPMPWPAENSLAKSGVAGKPSRWNRNGLHQSQKPARWLVIAYLVMAGGVLATSLVVIAWPGI